MRTGDCVVAWFDMWEYQNQVNVVAQLLDTIAGALPPRSEVARGLGKLSRVALASASVSAGNVSFSGRDLLAEIDQLRKGPRVESEQLERLIGGWRKYVESRRRIVVIVDNLDRVRDELSVGLLEQISSLFGFSGVIFLLAADRERLAIAVERQHSLPKGDGLVYLEKIVQVEFRVPGAYREQVLRWMDSLSAPQRLSAAETELVAEAADWNLRQIKRLLNNVRVLMWTAQHGLRDGEGLALASTLILHHNRDTWLRLTSSESTRKQVATGGTSAELEVDDLLTRVFDSPGGQRLLELSDSEMQLFLSSAESALTTPMAEDPDIKKSIQDARAHVQLRCD
ncbi:MAG: KAP family P-loop NTPase fold protein, partial [Acidimicrobiia bacterium]